MDSACISYHPTKLLFDNKNWNYKEYPSKIVHEIKKIILKNKKYGKSIKFTHRYCCWQRRYKHGKLQLSALCKFELRDSHALNCITFIY
jgi:hypothetical protein